MHIVCLLVFPDNAHQILLMSPWGALVETYVTFNLDAARLKPCASHCNVFRSLEKAASAFTTGSARLFGSTQVAARLDMSCSPTWTKTPRVSALYPPLVSSKNHLEACNETSAVFGGKDKVAQMNPLLPAAGTKIEQIGHVRSSPSLSRRCTARDHEIPPLLLVK
jgi:hypothetical protein